MTGQVEDEPARCTLSPVSTPTHTLRQVALRDATAYLSPEQNQQWGQGLNELQRCHEGSNELRFKW